MGKKHPSERMVSAGGAVYRINDGRVEWVVCSRNYPAMHGLPKGTPEPGETREQTAVREVREETGLEVKIEGLIGSIAYGFVRSTDGMHCCKTVFFYLMRAVGGDLALHDREFDVVKWLPGREMLTILTYENEVRIVEKGISLASRKHFFE